MAGILELGLWCVVAAIMLAIHEDTINDVIASYKKKEKYRSLLGIFSVATLYVVIFSVALPIGIYHWITVRKEHQVNPIQILNHAFNYCRV